MKFLQRLLLLSATLFFIGTANAQKGYIKLGEIKGEATQKGHEKWINILSCSQSISKAGAGATGSTRMRAATSLGDIVFRKKVDAATPKITEALVRGNIIPSVDIDFVNAAGQTYYKIEMKNVLITSYNLDNKCDPNCEMSEEVAFYYEKITWTYTDRNGSVIASTYDREKNK